MSLLLLLLPLLLRSCSLVVIRVDVFVVVAYGCGCRSLVQHLSYSVRFFSCFLFFHKYILDVLLFFLMLLLFCVNYHIYKIDHFRLFVFKYLYTYFVADNTDIFIVCSNGNLLFVRQIAFPRANFLFHCCFSRLSHFDTYYY